MIPVFSHCQDCGNPPIEVKSLWSGEALGGWWCRICKKFLV